jgi:magnesium-transporting ATPase (P-type)
MYSHEMRSYDCSTYQYYKEWKNQSYDCSTYQYYKEWKNQSLTYRKNIAQMYYWTSLSFRIFAIFFKLVLMIILIFTIIVFFSFLLFVQWWDIIFFICLILTIIIIFYLYRAYQSQNFGFFLKKLIKISNNIPLISVCDLRTFEEIWDILKEKDWLYPSPFEIKDWDEFRREFEEFCRE